MGQSPPIELQLSRSALVLDIDGTLAPIHEDPDAVRVPAATLELLERLVARAARVAVATGRSLDDAMRLVPVDGLWYAASHGMHMRAPDGTEDIDQRALDARPHLDMARTLAQTVGWRHEDKTHAITLHFRHLATPELTARQMRAQMATVLDPRALTVHDARMALEIRPTGARTKADAVRMLASDLDLDVCMVMGDDLTDLDAFNALDDLNGVHGLRIAVGSDEIPESLAGAAEFVLDGQHEVAGFLARLLESDS